MMVAGVETSQGYGGVALSRDYCLLGEHAFQSARGADTELIPALGALCKTLKVSWADVGLLAVDVGPGSYTGLRIGLATIKALSFASHKPIVTVTSFEALVEGVGELDAPYLCAVLDAKRKEVYAAIYTRLTDTCDKSSHTPSAFARRWALQSDLMVIKPEALVERIPPGTLVLGNGLGKYLSLFTKAGINSLPEKNWIPRASVVARLGLWEYAQGKQVDINELEPLYLRIPQAEERWRERKDT